MFQATHLEETKKILTEKPITFYMGIDPTADNLHIGSRIMVFRCKNSENRGIYVPLHPYIV